MKKVLVLSNNLNGLFCFRRELIERLFDQGFSLSRLLQKMKYAHLILRIRAVSLKKQRFTLSVRI